MKVYRIQDKEGRGPFRPGFSHIWLDRKRHGDQLPPWFVEMPDVLKQVQREQGGQAFGTGCRTPEQLRSWFSLNEYRRLRLLGYSAVEINVDKVYGESDTQCVFGRRKPLRKGARAFELYDEPT